MFEGTYSGRNVLVTGHTGFKGSWLSLWLKMLGAEVSGLALAPETDPSHWTELKLDINSVIGDIRDAEAVESTFKQSQPEIVFHLAAQPLVRRSYEDPVDNWGTNVMGSVQILEACRRHPSVKAIVFVTTDKCYENKGWEWGYRETDQLGGHDPYSSSKAAAELVAQSYRRSYFEPEGRISLASARAGNVIGGGDWSQDRLIPDVMRALAAQTLLEIRSPRATRPWQHVLECLSGYLVLGEQLLGPETIDTSWNFGPEAAGNRSVEELLLEMKSNWPVIDWFQSGNAGPHEASVLHLDSSRARTHLGWKPVWTFEEGVAATTDWYDAYVQRGEIKSAEQIDAYVQKASEAGMGWASGRSTMQLGAV